MSEKTERSKFDSTEQPLKQAGILKNALKMVFGTFFSRILGLLREVLMAYWFNKDITDAWAIAFRIPNFFRRIFLDGAISQFVVKEALHEETHSLKTNKIHLHSIFTILFIVFFLLIIILNIFSDSIVNSLLQINYLNFSLEKSERYNRVYYYFNIMNWFVLFSAQFAFLMAILNAKRKYFWTSFAPFIFNLVLIISLYLAKQNLLHEGKSFKDSVLAWGVLIGGICQFLFIVFTHLDCFNYIKFNFNIKFDVVLKVLYQLGQSIIIVSFYQVINLINIIFVSRMTIGTSSFFHYVDRVIELPLTVITTSIVSVFFTELTMLFNSNKRKEFFIFFNQGLELVFSLACIFTLVLFYYAEYIAKVLFRSEFLSQYDVLTIALIFKFLSFTLLSISLIKFLNLKFICEKKSSFLVKSNVLFILIFIFVSQGLISYFNLLGLLISNIFIFFLLCGWLLFNLKKMRKQILLFFLKNSITNLTIVYIFFIFFEYYLSRTDLKLYFQFSSSSIENRLQAFLFLVFYLVVTCATLVFVNYQLFFKKSWISFKSLKETV